MERGKFIVIEGPDGVGTTTQTELIKQELIKMGKKVVSTCEPTDESIGVLIRKMLRNEIPVVYNDAMKLLFRADRIDHNHRKIAPLLKAGIWVICDRYYPSTLVYQNIEEDPSRVIAKMELLYNKFILSDKIIVPDLVVLLMANFEILDKRMKNRAGREIFESESCLKKVIDLYWLWNKDPYYREPRVMIDSTLSIDDVTEICIKAIIEKVENNEFYG